MSDDIRILSTTEQQRPDDAGRYRSTIVTRFMVGGTDGPFEVTQPEATFDPALQTQKMNDKAALVRALRQ